METEGREIRLLNNEIGAQAQLPPNVVMMEAVSAEEASKGEMKRRVLFLSVILAVYVVVNALVQYVFDAAAIESALEQISMVTDVKGAPSLAKLLLRTIPTLAFTIFLGLLVPLCGYLGAKQNSQGLVGCFCGCNFIHCSCSICALIGSIIVLFMLSAAEPGIEAYLEKCDPNQCTQWPESFSKEVKRQRTVDCLAAGIWGDQYHQVFKGPSYPVICPKVMLKCSGLSDPVPPPPTYQPWLRGHHGHHGHHGHSRGPPRDVDFGALATTSFYPSFLPRADFPEVLGLADPDEEATGAETREAAAVPMEMPAKGPFWRRLEMSHPREWKKKWDLPRMDDMDDDDMADMGDIMKEAPMPDDPLATCEPDYKGIKLLHQAGILVPNLVPKLVMLMAVKCLLLVPVILFGCLGFWWGRELWSKLGQGYGHLPDATLPPTVMSAEMAMPQVVQPVQPVQGVPVAAPVAVVEQE